MCNLLWSKNANEIVSTHGYSQNQIIAWKYPTMTKLATLTGHTMRVLYLACSPDGQTIVTGAGKSPAAFLSSHSQWTCKSAQSMRVPSSGPSFLTGHICSLAS